MNKEPLLENEIMPNEEDYSREKERLENKKEGYGNYDAFHEANFLSKIMFCWVNKVLRVINLNY